MARKTWWIAGLVAAAGLGAWMMRRRNDDDDLDDWDDDEFDGPRGGAEASPSSASANGAAPTSTVSPVGTAAPPAAAPAGTSASADAEQRREIKGNVRGEDLVYHLPGDPGYDETIEEVMFATVEEAEAAGFRPAVGHGEN